MKCPYCGMHYVTASCPHCKPNPHYMTPPPAAAPTRFNMPQAAPPRRLPVLHQPRQYPPAEQYQPPAQPPRQSQKIHPVLLAAAIFTGIAVIAGCFRFTAANLLETHTDRDFAPDPYEEFYPVDNGAHNVQYVRNGYYPAGRYTVGIDIPIGTFLVQCAGSAPLELEIYPGNSDEVLFYQASEGQYVTLRLGETVFFSGGTLIDAEICPDISYDNPFEEITNPDYDRMFMAGRDFPSGTYIVMLNSDAVVGHYNISDHGIGSSEAMRDGDALIDGTNDFERIQINDGEILTLYNTVLLESELLGMEGKFPQEGEYYPEGDYTVGVNIPAGQYIIYPDMPFEMLTTYGNRIYGGNEDYSNRSNENYFYMELTDQGETVISGWKSANCYVNLEDGQQLHLDDGRIVSTALYGNLLDPYTDPGMYVVGNDLPAGTYILVQNGPYTGDCAVFPDVPNDLTDSVGYYRTDEGIPFKLKDGQCVQLFYCNLFPLSD